MIADESDSVYLFKAPCPACGSRDNLAIYSDGHGHCFGCGHYEPPEGQAPKTPKPRSHMAKELIPIGEYRALTKRGISEETCRKWGYSVGEMSGKTVQIANYRNNAGDVVAQKVRFPNKDFTTLGDMKGAGLYGQHLWRDGGKMVVITEGEIDALTVSQLQANKWPVVSLPNGAQGAARSLAKALQWLEQFETVVLMFDMDEPGRAASAECVELFSPGKCKVASLPLKDPNEMLLAGRGHEVIDAIWGAKVYRPDGIVALADLKERFLKPVEQGLPWWSPRLTKATFGRRYGEIYSFGAGTGVGKSDFFTQQIAFDLKELKEPVAAFLLEQQPGDTARRIAGKLAGRRFHLPDGSWTQEELATGWASIEKLPLFLYDHFGAADWNLISSRIRYLRHSEGVRLFYLDHLTALAAAEEDERTGLERITSEMGALVQELGVTLHMVSHLATPDGTPHEEGGRVMIRHFKGSRAIGFWSSYMFGLERDQQAEDIEERRTTRLRILKDRLTGQSVGDVIELGYDVAAGRLVEKEPGERVSKSKFPVVAGDDDPF